MVILLYLVAGVMNVNELDYLLYHPFLQKVFGRDEKVKIGRLNTHCLTNVRVTRKGKRQEGLLLFF